MNNFLLLLDFFTLKKSYNNIKYHLKQFCSFFMKLYNQVFLSKFSDLRNKVYLIKNT